MLHLKRGHHLRLASKSERQLNKYNARMLRSLCLLTLLLTAPVALAEDDVEIDVARIHGRIQVVTSFPDYKVQLVDSFADLHVLVVENFPDEPGRWKMVESFPDYKIQFVDSFPDFTIKYVESFPGPP